MAKKAGKAAIRGKTEKVKYPRIDPRAAENFVSLQEIVATARRNLPQDAVGPLVGRLGFRDHAAAQPPGARQPRAAPARAGGREEDRHFDDAAGAETRRARCSSRRSAVSSASRTREGACNVARAAVAHGTTAFISTAAKPGLEEAAAAVKEPLIFQLYVRADRKWVEDILDRAKAAGYRALCVCVDRNYYGRRERDIISRANVREGFGDPSFQMGLQWKDLVWMKQRMKLPLIVKGVATAEDAKLSVEHGADVVYVSNHGGRQLDHAQGTIEVLPEVVAAVDGRAEILWDGGVQRGTDVVKALCLGARAVGVGKMLGWALAAAGEAGLKRMLELMDLEIRTAMGLMGVTSLSQLNPSWVRPAAPVRPATQTNAYPWFEEQVRKQ